MATPEGETRREGVSGHLLEWLMTGKLDVSVLYNVSSMNTSMSSRCCPTRCC